LEDSLILSDRLQEVESKELINDGVEHFCSNPDLFRNRQALWNSILKNLFFLLHFEELIGQDVFRIFLKLSVKFCKQLVVYCGA